MAKCPECGITVAFHGEEEVECWECGVQLKAVVTKDSAGFRLTEAVVVSKNKTSDKDELKPFPVVDPITGWFP